MGDFFISYRNEDQVWAEWVAWILEAAGYKCLVQAWDFKYGTNFLARMQEGATEYRTTLAVLTEAYFQSPYTKAEWTAAYSRYLAGDEEALLPVRIEPIQKPGLLGVISYIDFLTKGEREATEALLSGVKRDIRRKPATAPAYPGQASPKPPFPGLSSGGAGAIAFHVPLPRNLNFSGREEYLKDLALALAGGPAALTQAIAGLGGVGKTQLALEHCYLHRNAYALVWWVRCEELATLASDYAGLAPHVGIAPSQDQTQTVAAVRAWLAANAGWLLVLDNVCKPEDLKDYLPQSGQGHVLITSRHQAWGAVAQPVRVEVWPEGEAVDFLLKRTGSTDSAGAQKLATELGCLPLALEQAGAYVEETDCTLAEYLALLKTRQKELLAKGSKLSGYELTVATTWLPAFEAVQKKSPAAAELLNLCAFFAPDDIPLEVIKEGKEFLPPALAGAVDDPLAWNEALAALKAYSLVQRKGDSLSVHRLVQAVTRDRLGEGNRKEWAGAAVEVVNEAFPFDIHNDVASWPTCAHLSSHGVAASGHAQESNVAPKASGRLLSQIGTYIEERGEYQQAQGLFKCSLAIALKAHGPNHPEVAVRQAQVGRVLFHLGYPKEARKHLDPALILLEQQLGLENHYVTTCRSILAMVMCELGDFLGAMQQLKIALAVDERALGANHPKVATLRNNLGTILYDLGDIAGARTQWEAALSIWEKALNPNHPNVASARNNLSGLLFDLGDLAGAAAQHEMALAIRVRFLPPEHPLIILSLENLAACQKAMGNHDQATECRARADALQAIRKEKGLDG